jgi:hypothetical protein
LWEVQVEQDGKLPKLSDMGDRLKNLPAQQRQQIEAMMKARGVDMSGGANKLRICLDKASLDQGQWQGEQDARCKTDMKRGTGKWTWHSVCGAPYNAVTDGEATFNGTDSYVVKTNTTMTIRGETRTTQNTLRSKWVGADCGDVKPVQAMRRPLDSQAPKQK